MMVFNLYRLKIEWPTIGVLFAESPRQASDIILAAIEEKPSEELRQGQSWRIGNIKKLSKVAVFFALGKITSATHALYDEERGDFVEEAQEEAPHTYVGIDLELQVCAIAQKPKIAPQVDNIAKNLAKLLSRSIVAGQGCFTFTLSEISDPEEFLTLVKNAILISEFEMTFSPPNPFDVEQQFHKPMEELLQASRAQQGKTAIKGESLNSEVIEKVARSAAASGNKAKARIQSQGDEKPILKRLEGNPMTVSIYEIETDDEKLGLFQRIRKAYYRVRRMDRQS